jgi:hypothetical protein
MSFDYTRTRATVQRLLAKFGAETTLTTPAPTAPTYDTTSGNATPASPTVDTVTAAVFPYADKFVDGTMILAGDEQAFLSAVGITEPKPGSVLSWRARSYTTIRAKTLAPAGEAVIYELQVRA